jgi:hypothetical protein
MSMLLVAALLAATPEAPTTFASSQQAAEHVARESQTGALIFSKGDCLAVKVFGGGPYTHVAAVVMQNDEATVYDSMNGIGVRKQGLKEYLESQDPDEIHVAQPTRPMTTEESRAFIEHLETEVGRPYAVKHHLTGGRAEGIHCSEYVTDALMACQLLQANHPSRVSPTSLAEGIVEDGLYSEATTFTLERLRPEAESGNSWCQQLWIDTKICTTTCCAKMRRMFLCCD